MFIQGHHIINVKRNNVSAEQKHLPENHLLGDQEHHYIHKFSDLHLCIVFNAFVWMQVFNFFNARLLRHDEKFNANWRQSKMLLTIVAIIVVLQWGIVQFGGRFMSTVPLTWAQWAFCILVGSGSLLVGWISRLRKVTLMYFTLERACLRVMRILCNVVSGVRRHNVLQVMLRACYRRWNYYFRKSKRSKEQ